MMISKLPILENFQNKEIQNSTNISQDLIIDTLLNYSKVPFEIKIKSVDG